jgi:hypothetical protein
MAGSESGLNTLLGKDARCCHAHGHDGRLRILCEAQILFRAFETKLGKRKAEGRVGLSEGLSGNGKSFSKFAAHPNSLRALPRKQKRYLGIHSRMDCSGSRYRI